jgi:hypothetical protein
MTYALSPGLWGANSYQKQSKHGARAKMREPVKRCAAPGPRDLRRMPVRRHARLPIRVLRATPVSPWVPATLPFSTILDPLRFPWGKLFMKMKNFKKLRPACFAGGDVFPQFDGIYPS